jgi:hypothetical protein
MVQIMLTPEIQGVISETWVDTPTGVCSIGSLTEGDQVMSDYGITTLANLQKANTAQIVELWLAGKPGIK